MSNVKTVLLAGEQTLEGGRLRQRLEAEGYHVIEARDGVQAFTLAQNTHPNVVVSDLQLPRMDGHDLCRAIRRNESIGTTPVILVTSKSDPLDVIRGLDASVDSYASAPIDTRALIARIEALDALHSAPATEVQRHRQSQRMESLGALTAGIVHDFNSLLSAIRTNAEMALGETPDEPVRDALNEIHLASTRAKELAGRVLLFSRQQENPRQLLSLPVLVAEAATLLRAAFPRNIRVRVDSAPDVGMVLADASQLYQVIINLGTNAMHAMADRGGTFTLKVDCVAADRDEPPAGVPAECAYIRLTAVDTGHGIAPEVMDRIFEPFFTTRGQSGTGLGLSIVDGIVRDHRGAITVESEVGRGSTFRVFFPAATGI